MIEQISTWINRLLVIDVFVVIGAFFWFAIALLGKSLAIPLGWDLWYQLWQPVFTPAIGLLMGGAILNWLINLARKQWQQFSDRG
jgi:hypothetical protein